MEPTIIVAIVSGIATVLSVILTNNKANSDMNSKLDKSQAITDTKLEELTREVRMHNDFAKRIPVIEEKISVANHRIEDLEREVSKINER